MHENITSRTAYRPIINMGEVYKNKIFSYSKRVQKVFIKDALVRHSQISTVAVHSLKIVIFYVINMICYVDYDYLAVYPTSCSHPLLKRNSFLQQKQS
jgi:hypothetical protein